MIIPLTLDLCKVCCGKRSLWGNDKRQFEATWEDLLFSRGGKRLHVLDDELKAGFNENVTNLTWLLYR
jgi:hypothetical protein